MISTQLEVLIIYLFTRPATPLETPQGKLIILGLKRNKNSGGDFFPRQFFGKGVEPLLQNSY